jgi:hypothetical protein
MLFDVSVSKLSSERMLKASPHTQQPAGQTHVAKVQLGALHQPLRRVGEPRRQDVHDVAVLEQIKTRPSGGV